MCPPSPHRRLALRPVPPGPHGAPRPALDHQIARVLRGPALKGREGERPPSEKGALEQGPGPQEAEAVAEGGGGAVSKALVLRPRPLGGVGLHVELEDAAVQVALGLGGLFLDLWVRVCDLMWILRLVRIRG